MRKNNAGFSLIELVVVVAVIAVLSVIGVSWISRLSGYRARECASEISTSLTATKVQALSKARDTGDVYWQLERDASDNRYYVSVYMTDYSSGTKNTYLYERKRVSKSGSVSVSYTSGGSSTVIDSSTPLKLCYNRNTGAIYDKDTLTIAGVSEINVTNGNRSYKIEIVPVTGKVIGKH